MIASCRYLEEKFQECSKRGVGFATNVETSGVNVRTRTKQSGANEKAKRKKCDVSFSFVTRNFVFQKNFLRFGVRKLLR